MSQSIFVLDPNKGLTRMQPAPYKIEDDLQQLIADYPELLGVEHASDLLLIRREQNVPDNEQGSGRFSLDHLFVDRDAVPVLVEVKRAADTRIRREVVGQMLDYAANGIAYWPIETIQDSFLQTCEGDGTEPDVRLQAFIGDDRDQSIFWTQTESNLRAGRIRMLFVADEIPRELARIVEFMNEQMEAEVLAIEIKPYEGEGGLRTLVPRVIGNTERAMAQKENAPRKRPERISRAKWMQTQIAPLGADVLGAFQKVIDMMEGLGAEVDVTSTQGSLFCRFKDAQGDPVYPINLYGNGSVQLSFGYLVKRPKLAADTSRQTFFARFAEVVGPLSTKNISGYPSFDIRRLNDDAVREKFEAVAREFADAALVIAPSSNSSGKEQGLS